IVTIHLWQFGQFGFVADLVAASALSVIWIGGGAAVNYVSGRHAFVKSHSGWVIDVGIDRVDVGHTIWIGYNRADGILHSGIPDARGLKLGASCDGVVGPF